MNWTNQSKNDLNRIKDFISADSIYQAERMINEIYSSAQKILNYPDRKSNLYFRSIFSEKNTCKKLSYYLRISFRNHFNSCSTTSIKRIRY